MKNIPPSMMEEEYTERWVRYRSPCQCHFPKHDLTLDMEYDKELDTVSLRLYMPVCTQFMPGWWRGFFGRCRLAFRLVFIGYLEEDGEYIFPTTQSLKDFASVLTQSYEHLLELRKGESG